jgi:hypothetical protein
MQIFFASILILLGPFFSDGHVIPPRRILNSISFKSGGSRVTKFRTDLASNYLEDRLWSPSEPKKGPIAWILRLGNHAPAAMSLAFFGLVSMSSMMPGVMPLEPTLTSVLTQRVGPTTNRLFADYFPTLVTPPPFVFLVWPTIVLVQICSLIFSALQPINQEAIFTQDDLTALSLSNLAATWWLTVASQTEPGRLNVASCLILPLVPIFSGYPLRQAGEYSNESNLKNIVFQLYSGFTVLASFLALAVELQHGGRLLPKVPAEVAASVFIALYYYVVSRKSKSKVRMIIQVGAIVGIMLKRISEGAAATGIHGSWRLLLSVSFLGTSIVSMLAIRDFIDLS